MTGRPRTLEVADAERSLFNAQLAYAATQTQPFQSYANLYNAMGGGWVDAAKRLSGERTSNSAIATSEEARPPK